MGTNPLKTVKDLADILNETELSEIEYEQGDVKIKVVKQLATQAALHVAHAVEERPAQSLGAQSEQVRNESAVDDLENNPGLIKSPMVGIAYLSSSPGAAPFVNIGDKVTKGQTLLIIEAMKVLNMIKAPHNGIVKSFFVKNEEPVEYDQRLLLVESE